MDSLFVSFQQTLAGRYSIDREIGRGGMGIVYLAREVHLDRLVAIKLLPPERAANPSLRERFLREVRLAAKLSHPNIIPIHAVEERDDFVFYVMAFVDGETLTERVRSRGPLPGSEGARVLREVAWALAYAHEQGFVHRDVKPDNILLERSTGRVLVADFGIAAALGQVSADGISGTPEFMSPEQVLGRLIDARSDLYGLGATGFYALSGRFVFEGVSATELLAKHVAQPAPAVGSLGLPLPRKIGIVVDRCLLKEPDQRPASASAVADMLTAAMEQRRELPAALRAFVKRSARLNGGGTLFGALLLVPLASFFSYLLGSTAGFGTVILGAGVFPFSYFIDSARRLLRQGFSHADLAMAFKAEIEQNEEELRTEITQGKPALERFTGVGAYTLGGIGGLAFLALLAGVRSEFVARTMGLALGGSFIIGIVHLSIAQQRRDVDTKFWSRIWLGPIGRSAFKIARKLLGKSAPSAAMTHRATELSLGLAAEQLYESLPKETRKVLAAVPEILTRLQADAQTLRKQHDELQDIISISGKADEQLGRLRDSVHGKLGEAVGALETIRLDLLRLHAGSTSIQSVTTHLGLAADVSDEIGRLIAAREDVQGLLHYPRLAASTPV
jgi:hypothetical protein